NGSGKTSLLNLLPKIVSPTCGKVLIDNKPLDDYNLGSLRRSMAILSQTEEFYPVSIRDNLLLTLAQPDAKDDPKLSEKLDIAAHMGGASDLIQRLGWNRVLNRVPYFATSFDSQANPVGRLALQELRLGDPISLPVPISAGEKQRLLATRMFMRLNNSRHPISLLVMDEATSSLDPHAERHLLTRFLEIREGKTMIFVTHRFQHLAMHADTILVMGQGKVVQRGKHDELMADATGEYAKLYTAQASEL
ncbi:ABC transporter, partial [Mycena floridula]